MKKELGNSVNLKFTHNFESGELSIGARKGQKLVDATINIVSIKTGKSVQAGRTYKTPDTNPKKFILEPGQYRVDLKPVRQEGLAEKSITVEITATVSDEFFLEW